MKTKTYQIIEEFWTRDLGLESDGFGDSQVHCSVQNLYNGVQVFRRSGKLIIAVPPKHHARIQDSLDGLSIDELFSVNWLQSVLGQNVEKILGPAELYYADDTTFQLPATREARALSEEDSSAYRLLQAALELKDAEDSGFRADVFPAFGSFSDNILCAAANYSVWEPSIAHIRVATHPEYRRRGFAKAALGALAEDALNRRLILQWQAVAWNTNSLALAHDLGFEHYSTKIYARLRS